MARKKRRPQLSQLENTVMEVVWSNSRVTAEGVRLALDKTQSLKDSTIRTILRRLEDKGFVEHEVEGRTYMYYPTVQSRNVATDAVRGIIDRFCNGSVEDLLVGMVDDKILTPATLEELARRIADTETSEQRKGRKLKGRKLKGG